MPTTSTTSVGPFLAPHIPSTGRLLAFAAAGPVLFASAYLLTSQLPPAPWWNATTRVLPAGLILLAIHPMLPHGAWWWRSLLLGALNFGGFFALQAFSLHRIPGGLAATIASLQAVLIPLGAAAVLGERLRWAHLAAAATGVTGIALLALRSTDHLDPAGLTAAGFLALCVAAGMLLTRRWGVPPGVHHTTTTAWQMLAGGLLLLPAAFLVEGPPPAMTLSEWSITAWLAVGGTALAFAALFGALHGGLPPSSVSRMMLLCPLVAAAAGWLIYRQTLTTPQALGAALILTSAAACTQPPTSKATKPTQLPHRVEPAPIIASATVNRLEAANARSSAVRSL